MRLAINRYRYQNFRSREVHKSIIKTGQDIWALGTLIYSADYARATPTRRQPEERDISMQGQVVNSDSAITPFR